MKKILFACTLLIMGLWSCKSKTTDCKDVMCTEFFAQIMVELSSSSNPKLEGISTDSKLKKDGALLLEQTSFENNFAVVVDDSHLKKLGYNANHEVQFNVYLNGKLFGAYDYLIKTDCCHVDLQSGVRKIIID